ncbi:OmpW family outer membrane protein [Amaricoccus sp.]|uniref:outer membrane protein n=1 Tax=Amaricoccus sp. TaxID=1872485 RepID=UPI00261F360D|nr:OmpW family outer membrane protein [uncultured Amaricoccus sp.]
MTKAITTIALASTLAVLAGAASAQGFGDGSFYVKGFGGATWPSSQDFQLNGKNGGGSIDSGLDYDTGYLLGIAGGYNIRPNVAVELEYVYRNADADVKNSGGVSATTESNAWMVNGIYKFSPVGATQQVVPYLGAGLGIADLAVENLGVTADVDSDYQLAYQLIGGVGYQLSPNLTLNTEARFFGINNQTLENDDVDFKAKYHTLDLLIGATYSF